MNEFLREEIAAILAEAPVPVVGVETGLSPLDTSPRARKIRAILRIAIQYNWPDAVPHFLDTKGVASILDLTQPQLDDLLSRMDGYVDAAETGCSLPDCLPAC
ncbi:hypothetical protein EA658_09985 [Pseudoxanthomonas winnipegensis]|uniref:Uncharacterized protein n=1 Tax=Pseudoxanthomonas winnipegensis TaxID=2480810 RepID=A0ABY1WCY3_9GAMM|nr:hypothetical protein [Pseudoxanthomonas winnipegensis]TAA12440.1 hypothetical protein EA659_03665 [Pseudoxanthomonas winnipegensis]TAA19195.1 hypothetical protein EA658_09985 [Pseudoxanthomonas winnipegensis]TAH70456.1 hypothetical protein EA657_17050 [Pseudoxanthomonas winnipegensis]